MKKLSSIIVAASLLLAAAVSFNSCATLNFDDVQAYEDDRRIYLYGETHGQEIILQKELELWETYYNQYGFRHLFVEIGYSTGQLLNLWMQADDDAYLDAVFANWEGTLSHTQANYDFYKSIKTNCPDTVFHGTDMEHQANSSGEMYLSYLKENGMADSLEYATAVDAAEQAVIYYNKDEALDHEAFRETCMVGNFIQAFDALPAGEKVMGIYGSAHTILGIKNWKTKAVDNMATQLNEYYKEKGELEIYTFSLSKLKK